jgi:hypothetical protein
MRIHTGDKRFACPQAHCGKKFTEKHHLEAHIRTHSGAKPFNCSICGTCADTALPHAHVLMCAVLCVALFCCTGRGFADRSNLQRHLQNHSPLNKAATANAHAAEDGDNKAAGNGTANANANANAESGVGAVLPLAMYGAAAGGTAAAFASASATAAAATAFGSDNELKRQSADPPRVGAPFVLSTVPDVSTLFGPPPSAIAPPGPPLSSSAGAGGGPTPMWTD